MKKIIVLVLTIGIFLNMTGNSFAQANLESTPARPAKSTATGTNSAMIRANIDETKTANLKQRAIAEIQRRITQLNELLTKIAAFKHLTDAEKSLLSSSVTTEITSLTSLQTKIQSDTDLTTLKADVKSIVTSYRIFALFIPQIRLLAAAESLDAVADNMLGIATRLQTRVTELGSAGENTTEAQALLADMQYKLTDAKAQSNAITAAVSPLLPSGFPGNKSILQAARTRLKTGTTDVREAALDAKQIMKILKEIGKEKTENNNSEATPKAFN